MPSETIPRSVRLACLEYDREHADRGSKGPRAMDGLEQVSILLDSAAELAEATRGEVNLLGPREQYAPLDEEKVPLYDPKNPEHGLLEDIRRVNGLSEDFRKKAASVVSGERERYAHLG